MLDLIQILFNLVKPRYVPEMSAEMPSRGLLNANDIPLDLKVKISQAIEPSTIILLLNGELTGSGTLVTVDGIHGILTAAHVAGKWQNTRLKDQRAKQLGFLPDRRNSSLLEEQLEYFRILSLEPGPVETFGPDLAFVRIPSWTKFLSTLVAKKSFFDLTGPAVRNRLIAVARNTPLAACGVVDERTEKKGNLITLNQFVLLGSEPQLFEADGYDYIDLRSRRSLEPKTPNSFGGLSGCGLWKFSLAKISEGEIKPFDFQIAGVAFYQLPETDDGVATIRFHGPDSIYRRLLPVVRDWLRKN